MHHSIRPRHGRFVPAAIIVCRLAVGLVVASLVNGSPCDSVCGQAMPHQTIDEMIGENGLIAYASAVSRDDSTDQHHWRIEGFLGGEMRVEVGEEVKAEPQSTPNVGDSVLIVGHHREDSDELRWQVIGENTIALREFLMDRDDAGLSGAARLEFFFEFLDHSDPSLVANAHLEFVVATEEEFAHFASKIARHRVIELVESMRQLELDMLEAGGTTPSHVGQRLQLYLAMLAECGQQEDLPMIADVIFDNSVSRVSRDAWFCCYLAIGGEAELDRIDREIVTVPEANFIDRYCALIALRFLASREFARIDRGRRIASLRKILDDPQMADLAIVELAREQDWESVDRIANVFIASYATESGQDVEEWVRVPAVNFMRVCPGAEAEQWLEEFERRDRSAVERSRRFFTLETLTNLSLSTRIRPSRPTDACW